MKSRCKITAVGESSVNGWIQITLPLTTLARMLDTQQLCPADFRCLNDQSKQCVKRLCLLHCARGMNADIGPHSPDEPDQVQKLHQKENFIDKVRPLQQRLRGRLSGR